MLQPQNGIRTLLSAHTRLLQNATVQAVTEIADNVFELEVRNPTLAAQAQPGQFVNVRVTDGYHPLWRRPFSVHDVGKTEGRLIFLFSAIGRGTRLLSRVHPGDQLNILGPLGNSFPLFPGKPAVLVAGGLGIAPFLFFARQLADVGTPTTVLYGARTAAQLVPTASFEELGVDVKLTTDDGSAGLRGTVADLLEQQLPSLPEETVVYTCGPLPAVRAVARVLVGTPHQAYASLETRMACGLGACVGCPVRVHRRSPSDPQYKLVCKDGPIFNLEEVDLET